MTRKPPFFGSLLRWRVVEPREIHTATYNGRDYTIRHVCREAVRARFGHGRAGWYLDDPEWDYGYPLREPVRWAWTGAELKIVCPWAMPTCSNVAPSLHPTILGLGSGWDNDIICHHEQQGLIELTRRGEPVATVRIDITMPDDPATAPIGVNWVACRPGCGDVVCGTWDEAFVEAAR